jgi:transcriptional regulator with XRE-family HTH domain
MKLKNEIFISIQNNISNRLKDFMSEKDINQSQLSKLTGISNQAISNWLSNKGVPSIEMLYILSDFFNCSIDYLVGKNN